MKNVFWGAFLVGRPGCSKTSEKSAQSRSGQNKLPRNAKCVLGSLSGEEDRLLPNLRKRVPGADLDKTGMCVMKSVLVKAFLGGGGLVA